MTAAEKVVAFPARRFCAIWIIRAEHWLVVGPRGHGWAFANRDDALREARWLARNRGLPIREVAR